MQPTWKPHEKHGRLTAQSDLPDTSMPSSQRKEPLTDARHVRNAVARFDQVTGVSDADRALAFANIEKAAKYYDVDLSETSWRDLGVHPQRHRKEAAAKGVATKRRRGELKDAAVKGAATRKANARNEAIRHLPQRQTRARDDRARSIWCRRRSATPTIAEGDDGQPTLSGRSGAAPSAARRCSASPDSR